MANCAKIFISSELLHNIKFAMCITQNVSAFHQLVVAMFFKKVQHNNGSRIETLYFIMK